MDAGRLDRRLSFEAPRQIEDGNGNYVDGFVMQFTQAAAVAHMRGSETVVASRLQGLRPAIVTIRASVQARAIGSDWRIVDPRDGVDEFGKPRTAYQVKEPPRHPVDKSGRENRALLEMLVVGGVAA